MMCGRDPLFITIEWRRDNAPSYVYFTFSGARSQVNSTSFVNSTLFSCSAVCVKDILDLHSHYGGVYYLEQRTPSQHCTSRHLLLREPCIAPPPPAGNVARRHSPRTNRTCTSPPRLSLTWCRQQSGGVARVDLLKSYGMVIIVYIIDKNKSNQEDT